MKVLCVLAKKNESQMIFRLIKVLDPNAFVSQSSVIGVYGEGFDPIKVKAKAMPEPPKRPKEEAKEQALALQWLRFWHAWCHVALPCK